MGAQSERWDSYGPSTLMQARQLWVVDHQIGQRQEYYIILREQTSNLFGEITTIENYLENTLRAQLDFFWACH